MATRVSKRTRAIIPVHLYGELGHIDEVLALAKLERLFVVEDACQAFGSNAADSRKAGTLGDIGCFSFFPTKVLGALGDAGLLCTADRSLAERLRSLRSHGRSGEHRFCLLGGNFRMDALHAAVLDVLLDRVDAWIDIRTTIAERYTAALGSVNGLSTPGSCMTGRHAWSAYTIRVQRSRDELANHLTLAGIETGIYYPTTLADQPLFEAVSPASAIENARQAATQVLSLPIHPGLCSASQALVVKHVLEHLLTESPHDDARPQP